MMLFNTDYFLSYIIGFPLCCNFIRNDDVSEYQEVTTLQEHDSRSNERTEYLGEKLINLTRLNLWNTTTQRQSLLQ